MSTMPIIVTAIAFIFPVIIYIDVQRTEKQIEKNLWK